MHWCPTTRPHCWIAGDRKRDFLLYCRSSDALKWQSTRSVVSKKRTDQRIESFANCWRMRITVSREALANFSIYSSTAAGC